MLRLSFTLAALWLGGCQLVLGFEDFERGGRDAAIAPPDGKDAAAAGSEDGGRDAAAGGKDAASAATPDGSPGDSATTDPDAEAKRALFDALAHRFDGAGSTPVPDDPAEDMVAVRRPNGSWFLIHKLEVSRGEYAELLASPASTEGDDGACLWKTGLSATDDGSCGAASSDPELPATCVDWCDARSYCEWRGLELCRGDYTSEAQVDPARSDWYAACSNGGERVYPYGDQYAPTVCNGADNEASGCPDACSAFAVSRGTSCESADGALNLSGNAAEWTAACEDSTGAGDNCRVRGGSYRSTSMALQCEVVLGPRRDLRQVDIGFRCCFYADEL